MSITSGRRHGFNFLQIILLLSLSACGGGTPPRNYYSEARGLILANQVDQAEQVLQQGIRAGGNDSRILQGELLSLYIKTQQYDKAEQYLGIASYSIERGAVRRAHRELADAYFERKDWKKAFDFYMAAGDDSPAQPLAAKPNEQYDPLDDPSWCPDLAGENYRNAGAAAVNMRDRARLKVALDNLKELATSARCSMPNPTDPKDKAIAELSDWLRTM